MILRSIFIGLCAVYLLSSSAIFAQEASGQSRKLVSAISKKDRVELAPTISADGRTMIFETENDEKWELYQTTLNDAGQWTEPVALKAINDKCNFLAGPSLSYDGNTLYYTAFIEGVTQSEDIFYSERLSDNQWSEPKPIGAPINQPEGYDGFPSIAADGSALYFIRLNPENDLDKKSKEPCFTIYVSHRHPDGGWQEPKMLPAPVNSGCERDPRIMADNHTLIFSSIRPGALGKYDLYQSQLQRDGSWSAVQPLTFVNSTDNDQSPCIAASGKSMFYFSKNDIYETVIPEAFRQMINVIMNGRVRDVNNGTAVAAKIYVKDVESGEVFENESNPVDGRYSIVMRAGKSYEIAFENDKYVPYKQKMDFKSTDSFKEEKVDIRLSQNFNLKLQLKDKDLADEDFKALVSIRDSKGNVLLNDSVSSKEMNRSVVMIASEKYKVGVYSPDYQPYEGELAIPFNELKPEVDRVFELEHQKIAFVADVTELSTGNKKRVKVTYTNETTHEVIVADAGEVVNLRKGDRYQVVTNSEKGYAYAMKSIVAGGQGSASESGPVSLSMAVVGLEVGAKLTLNYIYFDFNSASLTEQSATELKTIVRLLKENPNITIEISAHTDDVGSDDYNNNLSQKRANSVVEYLKTQGIPAKQLVGKGYGKTKPIAPNDSEENRHLNRRVELLVVKAE